MNSRTIIFTLLFFVTATPMRAIGDQHREHRPKQVASYSAGERIYRDGILPSGKSMLGYIKGDLQAHGSAFACVSCHMRSGLGSMEGNILTTPTNGSSLYAPRAPFAGLRTGGMSMGTRKSEAPPVPLPPRPAYTDESLAAALRGGIDPSGRTLDPIMPRYNLPDGDMTVLISYLKNLSAVHSSGVDANSLKFATVITDGLDPQSVEAHLAPIENFIAKTNERMHTANLSAQRSKKRPANVPLKIAYRTLSHSRWLLKGKPETWQHQLEDYQKNEPVFALIGGMSSSVWQPVHEFCESNRIPCLFPLTDFPVISESDWYTQYLSKGYFQEGESAAGFIHRIDGFPDQGTVLLLVRESKEGEMLESGFRQTWRSLGRGEPKTHVLRGTDILLPERVSGYLQQEKPDVLVVWDDATAVAALNAVAEPGERLLPRIVLSSTYIGQARGSMNSRLRSAAYLTWPERLPTQEKSLEPFFFGNGFTAGKGRAAAIIKRTYPLITVLSRALAEMKEQFYRDYLLDSIAMIKDQDVPLYERLSFGPGQRYASKGCYIVQLGDGDDPDLIPRSDWVIH